MGKKRKSVASVAAPYLTVAAICEKGTRPKKLTMFSAAKKSVLWGIHRPPKRSTVAYSGGRPRPTFDDVLIIFKSGDFRGRERELRISFEKSFGGAQRKTGKWPVTFGDPPEGGQVIHMLLLL